MTVDCQGFQRSANTRVHGCERCGKVEMAHVVKVTYRDDTRPRAIPLERELTETAAKAAGLPDDLGLSLYADARAHPGGIRHRTPEQWFRDFVEEIADARNYAVWRLVELHPGYMRGEPDACEEFERWMRRLTAVLVAWRAIRS
jgi:hypothetical protein